MLIIIVHLHVLKQHSFSWNEKTCLEQHEHQCSS